MAEQARLSMKVHAYWRERILWKTMRSASKPEQSPNIAYWMEEISHFFTFTWMPTLGGVYFHILIVDSFFGFLVFWFLL